jgi:hypothetical protein
METEKDCSIFYFNCVLRDAERGAGRPSIRCTDNG